VTMPDDAQLSRPAFEKFKAGLSLVGDEVVVAEGRDTDFDYETKVISPDRVEPTLVAMELGSLLMAVESLAGAGIDHPRWWSIDKDVVTVSDAPEYAVVNTWSLTEADDVATSSRNATDQYQAVQAARQADPHRSVEVTEAWELTVA